MLAVDKDGVIRAASLSALELTRYEESELVGMNVDALVPPAFRQGHVRQRDLFWKDDETLRRMARNRDVFLLTADQNQIQVEVSLARVAGIDGGIVLASLVDVSGRYRERAKTEAKYEVELETVFNAVTSGIVAFDMEGRIVRINNRARHFLGGVSDPLPLSWPPTIEFLDVETSQPLDGRANPLNRVLAGNSLRGETHLMRRLHASEDKRFVRIDSAKVDSNDTGVNVVLVIDDVSNQERNRQVVERKGRLDALGQLTGGIAHDFNNLLASMLYAVELARTGKKPERQADYLHTIRTSIERGRELTGRLLSFAKKQPGLSSAKLTSEVFHEFEKLVRPMLEEQIELEFEQSNSDLLQYCDQTQLETAIMNLVLNARDAILRSGEGSRIKIKARPVRAANDDLENRQSTPDVKDVSAGSTFRYIEISVSDDGPGMDAETLARCTDPFFTTKDSNSGTGLGLAMVYGFARQSDGDLRIYSEEGVGTSVQLTLPRGTPQGTREGPIEVEDAQQGLGQTLLVVEDEVQLLLMITDVLENLGYKVLGAKSGEEAMQLIKDGAEFDLLLTDVVMPGKIGGFELAKQVREILPNIPVIYSSGYTGFTRSEMGKVQAPLLRKPAAPNVLAEAISSALVQPNKQ